MKTRLARLARQMFKDKRQKAKQLSLKACFSCKLSAAPRGLESKMSLVVCFAVRLTLYGLSSAGSVSPLALEAALHVVCLSASAP